ncbi:uncharacterized protein LOC123563277 [Mercenaria mercenaria]|uniref:uncharacterized protein LOC123563277 n=1 Tax=Mercenaria mercenaria TaxID=6596 RepID=UPI001E1D9233|nr:uncharacterized protein LOC123563277 [Mercenaria mercenaria]
MSSRLRDGNPNVVDLSDQNRPMKVGEQFSELYDNQWTDAYSAVENHFKQNEPKIIAFMLGILEQCFNTCQNKARNQLERLQKGVTNLEAMITKKRTKLPNDLMQRIKEERKHSAADAVPEYTNMVPQLKKFLSSHVRDKTDLLEQSALKDYTQECLRLSWLMVIQDPPMTMVLKSEVKAIDNFKVYKHRGNRVDFIVWPALLLQEGGQLISKGVAEFRK